MRLFNLTVIVLLSVLLFLSGCASSPEESDETKGWAAEKFYQEAATALKGGDYETAIKYFEKLEARYPFGRYAQQAQLETAYAYYKFNEPESAIAAADRFIKLHPRNERVDYAYYLRGLASFPASNNVIENVVGRDPTQLDEAASRRSFNYFAELVKQFPNSEYVKDAKSRMIYLRNSLAQYELNVAKFYFKRGAYVATANRAKYIVDNYQNTPSMPDALKLMAAAYQKMGIKGLADDTLRVLDKNQPQKSTTPQDETTEN